MQQVLGALHSEFPQAEAYRYNSASIRIRIIDERFRGQSKVKRQQMLDPLLNSLPEKVQNDIMVVLLLAPEEIQLSMMNVEFDNPTPSRL